MWFSTVAELTPMEHHKYETCVLHLACASGELNAVKKLLSVSESPSDDIFKKDEHGNTALHASVEGGNSEIVKVLANICKSNGVKVDPRDARGDTPLHLAVRKKNEEMVLLLIAAGADPILKNADYETPVLVAVDNPDILKLLVRENLTRMDYYARLLVMYDHRKSVKDIGKIWIIVLNTAVQFNHIAALQDSLDYNGDLSILATYEGSNAMERAIRSGEFPLFLALLKKLDKSKIDGRNEKGETLLHLAMNLKRHKMALFLIVSGACPTLGDSNHKTPARQLNEIAGVDHFRHTENPCIDMNLVRTEVLHFLIHFDLGKSENSKTTISELFDLDAPLTRNILMQHGSKRDTALHAAVKTGNHDLLQLLLARIERPEIRNVQTGEGLELDRPAECDVQNGEGETPLQVCLQEMSIMKEFKVKMAGLLLDYGAHPDTVSLQLVAMNDFGLLNKLLEKLIAKLGTRSNLEAADEIAAKRITVAALQVACKTGNEAMVSHLLEWKKEQAGALIVSEDPLTGETAAHAAVRGGKLSVLQMVLGCAGSGDAARSFNPLGQTPLHFALAMGDVEMVKALEGAGAEHTKVDKTGAGSFHFAARARSDATLAYLRLAHLNKELPQELPLEAELNRETSGAGLTPLHYAAWNSFGRTGVVRWLLKNGAVPSLETRDKVEEALPWEWAVMSGHRGGPLLYLVQCHAEFNKPLFPGENPSAWQRVFQRIGEYHKTFNPHRNNLRYKLLNLVCWMLWFIDAPEEERNLLIGAWIGRLEPGLLACSVAYGDEYTNNKLASLLKDAARRDKEWAVKLAIDSRLLEWAAQRAGDAQTLKIVEPVMKVVVEFSQAPGNHALELLKFAFTYAFDEASGREMFLKALAGYCRDSKLTGMVMKQFVKEKAKGVSDLKVEDWLHILPRADRKLFNDDVEMIENDVPLAFWIAVLVSYFKSAGKRPGLGEGVDVGDFSYGGADPDRAQNERYVERVDAFAREYVQDYPNEKGGKTGRTALHWAAISNREEIVLALQEKKDDKSITTGFWRSCKPDVYDENGKPPCWYARNDRRLLTLLKWDTYMGNLKTDRELFIDGLNAILVGAALISSVTFAGFLNPPLGFNFLPKDKKGQADALKYAPINTSSVKAFWVCNSLSFFCGISSALVGVTGVLPSPDEFNYEVVRTLRMTLLVAAFLLVLSIIFVLLAFAAAGFAGLPPGMRYQRYSTSTTSIGGLLALAMLLWFLRALCYFLPYPAWFYYCVLGRGDYHSSKLLQRLMGSASHSHAVKSSEKPKPKPLAELLNVPSMSDSHRIPSARGDAPWEDGLDALAPMPVPSKQDGKDESEGSKQEDHTTSTGNRDTHTPDAPSSKSSTLSKPSSSKSDGSSRAGVVEHKEHTIVTISSTSESVCEESNAA